MCGERVEFENLEDELDVQQAQCARKAFFWGEGDGCVFWYAASALNFRTTLCQNSNAALTHSQNRPNTAGPVRIDKLKYDNKLKK